MGVNFANLRPIFQLSSKDLAGFEKAEKWLFASNLGSFWSDFRGPLFSLKMGYFCIITKKGSFLGHFGPFFTPIRTPLPRGPVFGPNAHAPD